MYNNATGNHVTGNDNEQMRVMSSIPAKKRLAVKYRDTLPRDVDCKPPTSVSASCQFHEDPTPTGKSLEESSFPAGHRYVHRGYYDDEVCVFVCPALQ